MTHEARREPGCNGKSAGQGYKRREEKERRKEGKKWVRALPCEYRSYGWGRGRDLLINVTSLDRRSGYGVALLRFEFLLFECDSV